MPLCHTTTGPRTNSLNTLKLKTRFLKKQKPSLKHTYHLSKLTPPNLKGEPDNDYKTKCLNLSETGLLTDFTNLPVCVQERLIGL